MAQNIGKIPVDFTSDVGKWRLMFGDTVYTEVTPTTGDFTFWSDAEIEANITIYGVDNHERSIGMAYLAVAGQLAAEADLIKTYDLQLDARTKAAEMLKVANRWLQAADSKDADSGLNEAFFISSSPRCRVHIEGTSFYGGCEC